MHGCLQLQTFCLIEVVEVIESKVVVHYEWGISTVATPEEGGSQNKKNWGIGVGTYSRLG